jgi:hypothetical protein
VAYQFKNLSRLGYANGFTLWHYRTADLAVEVSADAYFNPASRMVCTGDFILLNAQIDSTPAHSVLVVTATAGGAVEVASVMKYGEA